MNMSAKPLFKNECCVTSAGILRFEQKGRCNCGSPEEQKEKICRGFEIYMQAY